MAQDKNSAFIGGYGHQLPSHLVKVPGSKWAFWKWVCLRGAGLPADLPAKLSGRASVEADLLIAVEDEATSARDEALELLSERLAQSESETEQVIKKAIRNLKKDRPPEAINLGEPIDSALERFRVSYEKIAEAWENFCKAYDDCAQECSRAIREIALTPKFREAVVWQNRFAFHTGIAQLLREANSAKAGSSKLRQHEELVAIYLQRYCLKNDTIGFFGPVGWAELNPNGETLSAIPGEEIVAERRVHFETWCINEVARSLDRDGSLKRWLVPGCAPLFHLEGSLLHNPSGPPVMISKERAAVLDACNGERTAEAIAKNLLERFPSLFKTEAEVMAIIEELAESEVVLRSLEVPMTLYPQAELRQRLESISDSALREASMQALDELETCRAAVAASAGNAERLDRALADLEEAFTRRTSAPATRRSGETYAGRTLIYEDCRRDIKVELGSEILESLEPPLSLLLTSARWFAYRLAEVYKDVFKKTYNDYAQSKGSQFVPAGEIINKLRSVLLTDDNRLARSVSAELQRRWSDILQLPDGERCVNYSSRELRSKIESAFAAPRIGWQYARYHSPDIMIAADGLDAVRRGDYELVTGELHVATNTLRPAFFIEQHPQKEEVLRAFDSDLPRPRLDIVLAESLSGTSARGIPGLVSAKDYRLALTHDAIVTPGTKTLKIQEMVFEARGDDLMLRTRDGRVEFEAIEAMGNLMSNFANTTFKLLPSGAHTPRIVIDKLIVGRESWRVPAAEISFAFEMDKAARYVEARRWMAENGMPDCVFAKSPAEIKPLYADFTSPVYINILAKMIRRAVESGQPDPEITFSEMLPRPEQTWLPDSKGHRYTSEFRFVVIDLTA